MTKNQHIMRRRALEVPVGMIMIGQMKMNNCLWKWPREEGWNKAKLRNGRSGQG
eukprot:CAMPEP_0114590158 /NCGR_PEP_ID=MMETSP0125-20121206/12454_1 /TAXON_ID=485358 ORGANISM="Aristerostoma sp., Strain ATCC 50986" /NCGR_SAMPLE_ID=MMETSP0125 /ASSEMBLY_ACC=CAM_ASM_000245 /LENGTH=53 /DNA_ID=CAMNT_0001787461 /DNA_START=255 /DNA_END=416 /DNA_ORIENTATION=+